MFFTLLSLFTQFNTEQEKISNITEIQKSEINDNPIKQSKINKPKAQNFDTIIQEEINKLKQKEQ
jgi:hypothetical protein